MILISELLLLIFIFAKKANSYGSGAPVTICETMTPGHRSVPSNEIKDFTITSSCYKAGDSVTINVTPSSDFRGLLLMVKTAGVAGKNYGTFDISKTTGFQLIACFGNMNSAVTHMNTDLKTNSEFTWTPPSAAVENFTIYVTFLKDYATYWVNVQNTITPCLTTTAVSGSTMVMANNTSSKELQATQGPPGTEITPHGNSSGRNVSIFAYSCLAVIVGFGFLLL